jgi:predicted Rossmann fold nucleotide-binding protein DprA/Smf involved in DNA uptake
LTDSATVISGAALGIDAAAHRGLLSAGGRTVAVVPSGPGRPFPPSHASLLDEIAMSGGSVVTEQPPGHAVSRMRFIHRCRLMAALSSAAVIVEAAPHAASMQTAQYTARLGRPVMAVPGPVTSGLSAGCHRLVRDGAALVTSASDVRETIAAHRERHAVIAARRPPQAWVLLHEDRHGTRISLHASEDAATRALASDCRGRWDNLPFGDNVPSSPAALDDEAVVSTYFAHRQGDESYRICADIINGMPARKE